jgi:hypothetical protein
MCLCLDLSNCSMQVGRKMSHSPPTPSQHAGAADTGEHHPASPTTPSRQPSPLNLNAAPFSPSTSLSRVAGKELPEWLLFSPSSSEGRSPASGRFAGPCGPLLCGGGARQGQVTGDNARPRFRPLQRKGAHGPRLAGFFLLRPVGRSRSPSAGSTGLSWPGWRIHGGCSPGVRWLPPPLPSPQDRRGGLAPGDSSQAMAMASPPGTATSSAAPAGARRLGRTVLQLSAAGSCGGGVP